MNRQIPFSRSKKRLEIPAPGRPRSSKPKYWFRAAYREAFYKNGRHHKGAMTYFLMRYGRFFQYKSHINGIAKYDVMPYRELDNLRAIPTGG